MYRKGLSFIIALLMLISLMIGSNTQAAEDWNVTEYSCAQTFSVDRIVSATVYQNIGCYDQYRDAYAVSLQAVMRIW